MADALRALDVPYIALNPGASFRGLHDSLVNHLGNERPQMLLCLHEESAVAIAHGYAKVTGRPLAVALHANVGLFHATMAIFNAWCDRMPVLLIGATGPLDAARRRPWIDWVHTARDQGAIVRDYVKWDDQPGSPAAAREALLRAAWLAQTAPCAPVYVNLDAEMQEAPLESALPPIDVARYRPAAVTMPSSDALAQAVALLDGAARPLILAGRASRDEGAWHARVALAERLGARVLTDLKIGAAFPTDHPLHAAPASVLNSADIAAVVGDSDVVLSLDWVDLAGTLGVGFKGEARAKVISVTLDHTLHRGWSMDYQGLAPVDVLLPGNPDHVVHELLQRVRPRESAARTPPPRTTPPSSSDASDALDTDMVARVLQKTLGERSRPISLTHLPLSWNGASWPFRHPLDFLGSDGGGGIGAGPGIGVGAALALRGSGRLPIAICGDGDYLMGVTALWTATHYRIPLLVIVTNNQSFYNDEVHQERVARMRDRPVENKWIGQRIADPDVDLARMAEAQGAIGIGPITRSSDLADAFTRGIALVDEGRVVVIDVHVAAGYTPAMTAALTPGKTR